MKSAVLARFEAAFLDMTAVVDTLDEARLIEPVLDGWSVRDVLAHFAGYHRDMAVVLECLARGDKPPAPDGLTDDERNAGYASEARTRPVPDVVAEWRSQFERCRRAAASLPDERFSDEHGPRAWLDEESGHYQSHLNEIRAWLVRPGASTERR